MTKIPLSVPKTKISENEVGHVLIHNFQYPDWTLLSQVKNPDNGLNCIDLLAVQVRRSRLRLHGFEVKTDRTDWLHELRRPNKSGCWVQFCDRFYVAAPTGIVHEAEIPDGWGYLEIAGPDRIESSAPQNVASPPIRPGNFARCALFGALS